MWNETKKINIMFLPGGPYDWRLLVTQYWLLIRFLEFLGKAKQIIPRVLTLGNWEIKINN